MFDVISFTQLRCPVISGCVESWMQTNGHRIGTRDTHAFVIRVTIWMWYVWRRAAVLGAHLGYWSLHTFGSLLRIFKWTHFNQDFLSQFPLFFSLALLLSSHILRLFFTFLFSYVLIWPLKGSRTYSIYFIFRLNKKLTATKERYEKTEKATKNISTPFTFHIYFLATNVCNGYCSAPWDYVCSCSCQFNNQFIDKASTVGGAQGSLGSAYRHTTHTGHRRNCVRGRAIGTLESRVEI